MRSAVFSSLLTPHSSLLTVLLLALLPAAAAADSPPKVEKVQIGLPGEKGEQESPRSRSGAWAPVYVKLKGGPDGSGIGRFKIRVETADSENTGFHYDTPLPALAPNQDLIAVSYTRPGVAGSEFTVTLLTADDQPVPGAAPVTSEGDKDTLEPDEVLYVALGARLPGMKRALLGDAAKANVPDDQLADQKGTVRYAYIDDVQHMPDRWFGYEAADVVVLATGSETFTKSLLDDEAAPQRRKALAEWVRRGGRLIVSAGSQRQLAAQVLDKMPLPDVDRMPLLNCRIEAAVACPETANLARWLSTADVHVGPLQDVEVTRLVPGEGVTVLVSESCKDAGKTVECPLVVEASCGLGRVWLTAFDLDGPPFTTAAALQKAFWNRVQAEFTPRPPARPNQNFQPGMGGPPGAFPPDDDFTGQGRSLQAEVQRSLENFEQVKPVNFGWVALFILIYILIVGPLDYFLLTRVFKKPELTWVTFPVVVLTLSVLVYLVAYAMKGEDLRINKIDLVEYDLGSPRQAYGTTWMTLYSPRIQNYTLTVEPSAPAWAAAPPEDATAHAVTVAALANPDLAERAGSSSLFRKPYWYAEDARGMERVPIPVWSTRTFLASWRAGLDQAKPPVQARLTRPRGVEADAKPVGQITNNLPVPLQGVTVFYRGVYFTGPDIPAGGSVDVAAYFPQGNNGRPAAQWAGDIRALAPSWDPGAAQQQGYHPAFMLVKDLMFHARTDGSTMNNSGLRPLDQSWRLADVKTATVRQKDQVFRDELILVARTPSLNDNAEKVSQDPGSATRIWLDRLPGDRAARPPLSGFLAQQTYVRAYVPVTSEEKADQP